MKQPTKLTVVCVAADLIPTKLGGAELHIVEVLKRLPKNTTVHLFVGKDTSIQSEFKSNIIVHPIWYLKIPNLYGFSYIFFGYLQLMYKLRQIPFDILWAKQSFPQAPLAALLKLIYNKPLYITAQNPMLHKEELVLKGSLLQPFAKILTDLITPIIAWSYRQSDLVAAVSTYSQKLATKLGAKCVTVIPNGVDLEKSTTVKHKPSNQFRILTTSSLIPRNGIDILIKAVSLLKQKNWHLTIAGDGPEFDSLQQLSNSLGLADQINFLGRVNNQDIPKLLSEADIFVRPSRREGFGVSFIEAMAAGMPIVTTPVGGITDFLFDKKTGLFAKPEDPLSLATKITLLQSDKKLYKQLQSNALKLTSQKYSWDLITTKISDQFFKLHHVKFPQ